MSKPPLRTGDLVWIEFLDHAEDHEEILFEVIGRIHTITRAKVKVVCWGYAEDPETIDENVKYFTILRSAIQNQRKLR